MVSYISIHATVSKSEEAQNNREMQSFVSLRSLYQYKHKKSLTNLLDEQYQSHLCKLLMYQNSQVLCYSWGI